MEGSGKEEGRTTQQSIQQLIVMLESDSPFRARSSFDEGAEYIRNTAEALSRLSESIDSMLTHKGHKSLAIALERMQAELPIMLRLERDCVLRAHMIVRRIDAIRARIARPFAAVTLAHTPRRTLFTSMNRPTQKNLFIV